MTNFRFIHAADLHLDSPFTGLSEISPALGEVMHSATFQALDRIVEHTINSEADFLVLSGDLYDSRDRSLPARVQFRQQMERLADRDVAVYVVHGNHDPLNGWGADFEVPQNVVVFGGEARSVSVVRKGKKIAQVTGISYPQERVTENLARSFPPPPNDVYSIAVLHANVGHQTGHADYAPASVADLVDSGFSYWALGHVHTRSILSRSPSIVYPGNPQGRHVRERGPRGCFEVTVSRSGRTKLKFIETDVVRWERMDFAIDEQTTMDSLIDGLTADAKRWSTQFDGRTILRCRLVGKGPLHSDLNRDGVAAELQDQLSQIVDIEALQVVTGPEIDRLRSIESEPVVGDLLRLVERAREDATYRDYLTESLAPLFRRHDVTNPDPNRVAEWIEKAGDLGVDLLTRDS